MACSHTSTCPLFPLIEVNSALKVWKTFFCEGNYANCARYKLSGEGQSVPANLLPNGKSLALDGMTANNKEEIREQPKGDVARQVADEMASIDLGEIETPAPAATKSAEPAADPVEAAPAAPANVETFEATGDTNSWYLRIMANTDSGVVGSVIQTLGGHRVKIDAMAEKRQNGGPVSMVLIVLTDQVGDNTLDLAIKDIQTLDTVVGKVKKIKLEHLSPDMFN